MIGLYYVLCCNNDVNVIVLFDHLGANVDLLRVTATGVIQFIDYGEPDMADSETLRLFLWWGVNAYPAELYAVVIWDHGGGWKYIIHDTRVTLACLLRDLPTL